jgi:hypothetical protein
MNIFIHPNFKVGLYEQLSTQINDYQSNGKKENNSKVLPPSQIG